MTVSEARSALPQIIDRVLSGDEVTLTRHGRPVAVIVRPDVLRTRRADEALAGADRVRVLLEDARAGRLTPGSGLSPKRAEELVASVSDARRAR